MSKSKQEILQFIKTFADKAHGDQVRKYTGERYISHPVRVMEMVRKYNDEVSVLAAALLHDVLEDTRVTRAGMEKMLLEVLDAPQSKKAVQLVVELTDIFINKDYPTLSRRSRKEKEAQRLGAVSPEAQSIKYADIIDNITDIVSQDTDFARIFVREAKRMLAVMDAGHPQLREHAIALSDRCMHDLQKPAELS